MNKIEEEYKSTYTHHQNMEGVDAEGLWASIESQLPVAGTPDAPAGFLHWPKMGIAALLLFIGTASYLYVSDHSEDRSIAAPQEMSRLQTGEASEYPPLPSATIAKGNDSAFNSSVSAQEKGRISDSGHQNAEQRNTHTASSSMGDQAPSPTDVNSANETPRSTAQKKSGAGRAAEPSGSYSVHSESSQTKRSRQANTSVLMNQVSAKSSDGALSPSLITSSGSLDTHSTETARSTKEDLMLLTSLGVRTEELRPFVIASEGYPLQESPDYREKIGKGPSEIAIYAGVNLLENIFSNKENTPVSYLPKDISETTGTELGHSTGIRASWISREWLRFGLGIDYEVYRTTFEWQSSQVGSVTLENQLVGYLSDSLGMQTPLYGSQTYDAVVTRNVVHHNVYQLLSIPLEVGVQKRYGHTAVGVDLGASYSTFIAQKGRVLNTEGGIVDFDTQEGSAGPFAKDMVSFHARPFIDHAISGRFKLRISPAVRYLPSQGEQIQGIDRAAFLFSISGGIVVNLK